MTAIKYCLFILFIFFKNALAMTACQTETCGNFWYLNDALNDIIESRYIGEAQIVQNALMALKNGTGRAFNTSIGKITTGDLAGHYVLAIRVGFDTTRVALDSNANKSKITPGDKNFWWTDFSDDRFRHVTLYFLTDDELKPTEVVLPMDSRSEWFTKNDIRLSDGAVAFCAKPRQNEVATKFTIRTYKPNEYFAYRNPKISFDQGIQSKTGGNNWGFFHFNFENQDYSYLDWFYSEGIKFVKVRSSTQEEHIVPYLDGNYPLLGTGSSLKSSPQEAGENYGIMPLFSFGSNHLELSNEEISGMENAMNVSFTRVIVGVGHSKIEASDTIKYTEGSRIDNFRNNLLTATNKLYQDRYRVHNAYNSKAMWNDRTRSYHYLMFFYAAFLDENDKVIGMKMSNSFLPISLSEAHNPETYGFSLVFPTGITRRAEDTVVISMGVGDYYSALMQLPMSFVLGQCTHDATNLPMAKYEYKYLIFNQNEQVSITDDGDFNFSQN